jgi:outer membrane murein-binding lipoprotein Lpp
MAEISNQQIYDLLLEISNDVTELDASIDELLFDMKAFNQELSVDRHLLMQEICPQ